MDIVKILKDFATYVAWLVGIVTAPYLIALALSAMLGVGFSIMIEYVVAVYVAGFVIFIIYHSLKRHIRKEIYEILKSEDVIKTGKGDKK